MHAWLPKQDITHLTFRSSDFGPLSELVPSQGKQLGLKVDFAALEEANNRPEVPTRVSDAVFAA